jgi:Ca-activated chloride channel family protein
MQVSLPAQSSRVVSFVVDQSGSMGEPMPGDPDHSKMYIVQKALEKCIADLDAESRGTDLMSLMSFARAAEVKVPFSRDRVLLSSTLSSLTPETNPMLNGTALGYAVFKNVRLILACKSFASELSQKDAFPRRSMIVVTDGLEEPNPADRYHPFRSMRLQQALENAAMSRISVYYVNVDKNTYRMMTLDEREKLASAVARTGGKYFEVTTGASLSQILHDIAAKESIEIPLSHEHQLSLGFWLVTFAMLFTALSRLLETAIMRVKQ